MKGGVDFDPARYAPVAERITQFYGAFPSGRIVTELMSRTESEVVFRATVYRDAQDANPATTGWAAEREGDGDINEVACLENTETSAIGRALANLGFTASRLRPSAEEMQKADRLRARNARHRLAMVREPSMSPMQSLYVADLLTLLSAAERAGMRRIRAANWRRQLEHPAHDEVVLLKLEGRLRSWIARHPNRFTR